MTEPAGFIRWQIMNRIILMTFLAFMVQASIADSDYGAARALVKSGKILPLEQILGNLEDDTRGKILEVEFEREGDRYIYEIEMLDDSGIVHELEIDAESGELLKIKVED